MQNSQLFAKIRNDFPQLQAKVRGKDFVYLDSAATTLKPRPVVDRISHYYLYESANVHRGAHYYSDLGTQHFEEARQAVAKFLGADSSDEIVFTKGTTESINLVAHTLGRSRLKAGDLILVTEMEHHANIVPWQLLEETMGIQVQAIRVTDEGDIDQQDLDRKLELKPRVVAFTACSNTLGTLTPVAEIVAKAKAVGALTVIDAAQAVSQVSIDVQKWGCDFLAFSAHKLFGPTGMGILFGRKEILETLPPYQSGGSMISKVCFPGTTYNDIPFRFEAGTPHVEGVIGLKAALDYFAQIPLADLRTWEESLLKEATKALEMFPEVQIYGHSPHKAAILSFQIKGVHHSDLGQILDQQGVAVRAGHHCTQPLMARLGVSGTVRASFSIYNNQQDVTQFIRAIEKAREMLL